MIARLRIYEAAAKYIGTKEVPGEKSNPLIQKWIKEAADWLPDNDSATPWCGCFRGHVGFETATGVPRAHYRAANWLTWGLSVRDLDAAARGDTLVFKRNGGFHVALFHSYEDNKLLILGGNQSDSVCITTANINSLVGIRRAVE
jgi:uncharacterized protein (TIGR02594 family)